MHESLKSIQNKYNDLEEQLTRPEVLSNIKEYTKLSKEINSIKDVVIAFNKYENFSTTVAESKELLSIETDPEMVEMIKMEMDEANRAMPELLEEIKVLLIPKDPNDDKNVIVEIRGAAGGDEANIFAGDLFDIYKKWASANEMKVAQMESHKSDAGGFSLITFRVAGEKAYSKLKFESGVHRVQRIPATETQGRVHTSTVTVTVMPEADETVEIEIKPADLKIDTFRSSGAGGQSVNTTDSAVRITHIPTGVVVTSQDERSQLANREQCMKVLKTKLYDLEVQKQQENDAAFRALAGSGSRSEKVRTYNYPQDRVTDHRVSLSVSLKGVVNGNINNVIETLQAAEQAARIEEAGL